MTEYHLQTPLSTVDVEKLAAGDVVFLSGPLFTARDKAHALIRRAGSPISLDGAALYHCGPLILDNRVLSAGPTTSGRMARYTEEILGLGVRLAYPGGCGAAAAQHLRVSGVHLPELGMAESLWVFEAKEFGPMIVAVDAHGKDLYQEVRRSARVKEED